MSHSYLSIITVAVRLFIVGLFRPGTVKQFIISQSWSNEVALFACAKESVTCQGNDNNAD